jgi:hypothetical protein
MPQGAQYVGELLQRTTTERLEMQSKSTSWIPSSADRDRPLFFKCAVRRRYSGFSPGCSGGEGLKSVPIHSKRSSARMYVGPFVHETSAVIIFMDMLNLASVA